MNFKYQGWKELEDTKGAIRSRKSKIPKGQSEAVTRRRRDNTMTKRKKTKGQTTIYKTLHRKLKIEQHGLH